MELNHLLEHFTDLFQYNFWANDLFIDFLLALPPNQQTDYAIKSMSHILNAHNNWLARINGQMQIVDPWKLRMIYELKQNNKELYNLVDLALKMNLNTIINYTTSVGDVYQNSIRQILTQVLNHSEHHRAQMAYHWHLAGIKPPASDYIFARRSKTN